MVLCLCQQLKTQIMSEQILSLCPLDQTDDLHPDWDPWFFLSYMKTVKNVYRIRQRHNNQRGGLGESFLSQV